MIDYKSNINWAGHIIIEIIFDKIIIYFEIDSQL